MPVLNRHFGPNTTKHWKQTMHCCGHYSNMSKSCFILDKQAFKSQSDEMYWKQQSNKAVNLAPDFKQLTEFKWHQLCWLLINQDYFRYPQ